MKDDQNIDGNLNNENVATSSLTGLNTDVYYYKKKEMHILISYLEK